jgi:hypothetical protein
MGCTQALQTYAPPGQQCLVRASLHAVCTSVSLSPAVSRTAKFVAHAHVQARTDMVPYILTRQPGLQILDAAQLAVECSKHTAAETYAAPQPRQSRLSVGDYASLTSSDVQIRV